MFLRSRGVQGYLPIQGWKRTKGLWYLGMGSGHVLWHTQQGRADGSLLWLLLWSLPRKTVKGRPGWVDTLYYWTRRGFKKKYRKNWARLMQKIYEVDPLISPKCQRSMKIISFLRIKRWGLLLQGSWLFRWDLCLLNGQVRQNLTKLPVTPKPFHHWTHLPLHLWEHSQIKPHMLWPLSPWHTGLFHSIVSLQGRELSISSFYHLFI